MKIQSSVIQVSNYCFFTKIKKNIILLIFGLFVTQYVYARQCGEGNCGVDGAAGYGPGSSSSQSSSSSQGSSSSNSNSSDRAQRTQQAIGALQSAIGAWAANEEQKEEEERERRVAQQAEEDERRRAIKAKYEQDRIEFNQNVAQLENDKSLNPWGNASGEMREKEKANSGDCIQKQFSTSSKEKYSLKNTCDYPVNIKYMFSSSKPFSGAYSTLQPNQQTAETARKDESFRYFVCTFPEVPQSLDGGCV